VHPFWIYTNVDAYAVATSEMRGALIERGIEPERIRVDGIPVDMRFADRSRSREAIRRHLGLPIDRPVVLVMGGGLGLGPVSTTIRELARLGPNLSVVVIGGRNVRLQRTVKDAAKGYPYQIRVLGFVDNVVDYMLASDVLLTKPGGLTTSEALSAELPMILVTPLPGQEERNASYLAQCGAALRPPRDGDIAAAVSAVLHDPARAARLRTAAARLRTPNAAAVIADRIDRIARVR
jgi:processive 1,2-diacylglycerol beta-glucosyltransferase